MTTTPATSSAVSWASLIVLAAFMTIPSAAQSEPIPLELDLSRANHVKAKALSDGEYEISTTGPDPYIHTVPIQAEYDPAKHFVLSFEYFCTEGLSDIQLFYGPPSAKRVASGPELLSSEGWSSYALNIRTSQEGESWTGGFKQFRIDLGRHPGRTIQLRNIQLRAPTADELELERTAAARRASLETFDAKLLTSVNAEYDAKITRIVATDSQLHITVNLPHLTNGSHILCETPFYQSHVGRTRFVWEQDLTVASERASTITIDRMRDGHDRVFSSFVIMQLVEPTCAGEVCEFGGFTQASHPRFVDEMPAKWSLTRDTPKSKKGLSGLNPDRPMMLDDYKALGIHNATKNIVMTRLVHTKPGKHTFPHTFGNTTVYIDRDRLQALDRSMIAMRDLDVVVSAIILIPRSKPMGHPDAAPQGIYAMANVVEPEGWNVYAAGLDLLAQRYTRPDKKFGRITHWILHNEVDAGWVWTNAGEKPMATYLDLYYRSMRTAQSVIRRYGHAGSVLMSLTHHWTSAHHGKSYPPKAMVDLLLKRSRQEGNFDWGLAYHPYPQNLRNPRTWLDKRATFDFNTPLITPKNLEVLDAYMHQPEMRYDGKVRTVVLSEQSANSPKHDTTSYRDQAAAIVYTWLKFEDLTSIESYIMHRWMDHPKEGGLNLGIRTYGSTEETGKKKPSWDVYRKLGTPEQGDVVEWAKTVIPKRYFDEIPAEVSPGERGGRLR